MNRFGTFKERYTFEERKEEASRIKEKYPDRIPVIVEKSPGSNIPDIDKNKFLVPSDLTVGQFIYVIRKRIKISHDKAIFIFINNLIPSTSHQMSAIYDNHKEPCGYLYVIYNTESTFG